MGRNQQPAGSAGAIGAASVASVEDGFSRLEAAQEAARQLEADCLEIKRRAVAQLSDLELQIFAAEVRAEEERLRRPMLARASRPSLRPSRHSSRRSANRSPTWSFVWLRSCVSRGRPPAAHAPFTPGAIAASMLSLGGEDSLCNPVSC